MSLEIALSYVALGWAPIPVPYRGKNPGDILGAKWNSVRVTEATAPKYFNGKPINVGVILGEASGELVDIDLDCPEAIALAPRLLPRSRTFGRASKPRSHWIFNVAPKAGKISQYRDAQKAMIVEYRADGGQTVFPGSVHEGGEPIEWADSEPIATVDAAALRSAVGRVAAAVLLVRVGLSEDDALGIVCSPEPPLAAHLSGRALSLASKWLGCNQAPKDSTPGAGGADVVDRARAYLARVDPAVSGSGGHSQTLWAAIYLVRGFKLSDSDALSLLLDWNARCQPPWERRELERKISEARKADCSDHSDGWLLDAKREKPASGGETDREPSRVIRIGVDEERCVVEGIAALVASRREVYQRGGMLARVLTTERRLAGVVLPKGTPTIDTLPTEILSMHLASAAAWHRRKETKDGTVWVPTTPPDKTVRQVAAYGDWKGVRVLEAIVETPVLRPDGTILDVPGYDNATGLLYVPNGSFDPVPSAPTLADARQAVDTLLDVVADFPFSGPEHRAAWLAGLLGMFSNYAYDGPAPLELIEAPERGSGKGLLASVQAELALGRPLPVTPQTKDDEELRKRILAIAMSGCRVVLFDNVTNLGGPVMDAALTSTTWIDRILGVSKTSKELPLLVNWIATGNNVALKGDVVRRILLVRLDPDCEQPDARTGFKHDPLIPWVRANRGRLVAAALTILRAYVAAGRPAVDLPSWGSYDTWSALVRGSLVWAGQPDPYLTRARLVHGDAGDEAILVMFEGLRDVIKTAGDARGTISAADVAGELDSLGAAHPLRVAIPELVKLQPGKLANGRDVGYLLRRLAGKIRGGFRLCRTAKQAGTFRWFLEPVASQGQGDGAHGAHDSAPVEEKNHSSSHIKTGPARGETCAPSAPCAPGEEWYQC